MTNDKLGDSLRVFAELGWDRAPLDELRGMTLGTPQQQKVARAGLPRGFFSLPAVHDAQSEAQYARALDELTRYGIFALRLGVDARRAVDIMTGATRAPALIAAQIIADRGPDYAESFIDRACVARWRLWTHSESVCGAIAVHLVHLLDFEVPFSAEYLKDWSIFAAAAFGRPTDLVTTERIGLDVIRSRFDDHLRRGIDVGTPATGPFADVFEAGLDAGLLGRADARELALAALDSSVRPGDRRVWTRILIDRLGMTDDEIVARVDALVPLIATGDAVAIECFALPLIARIDDERLIDVAVTALLAPTKKSKLAVLGALAARSTPASATVAVLAAHLAALADGRDPVIASAAEDVMRAWEAAVTDTTAKPERRGVWRRTPDVWEVPRLDIPVSTPEALADLAGVLLGMPDETFDIESERFLAVLVDLASTDLDAVRTALRGVGSRAVGGLIGVPSWLRGDAAPYLVDENMPADILFARAYVATGRLGELPVLLSTPTWIDMRIDPADLLDRLRLYGDNGVDVAEADLQLALARLDLARVTDAHLEEFSALDLPVRIAAGRPRTPDSDFGPWEFLPGTLHSQTTGSFITAYVREPMREPDIAFRDHVGWGVETWGARDVEPSPALAALPSRFTRRGFSSWHSSVVHPTWGEAVAVDVPLSALPHSGIELRQSVRRATPMGPVASAHLVGALRLLHDRAAGDAVTAAIEAFDRGLLRPGVAEARYLDGRELAALARVLLDLADDGLASVVWLFLDGIIELALAGTRMLAGTADVAEAMHELVAGAIAAVDEGIVEGGILAVPGLRALAARPGRSRAVVVAREVVARLPVVDTSATPAVTPSTARDFDEIWPGGEGDLPAIDDGAHLSAEWVDPTAPTKMLALDVRLDDRVGEVFRVMSGSMRSLILDRGCAASSRREDEVPVLGAVADVDLVWTGARLAAGTRFRSSREPQPLTVAMHAAVLTTICHDGDQGLAGESLVTWLQAEGRIGWRGMQLAIRRLLSWPDVSPARMVRVLDKHPRSLPVLWPILVESIAHAALHEGPPPRWLNRVLDVALVSAPYLAEAARRGWIPEEAARFPGLADIIARGGSSAVVTKARTLRSVILP
ncbi:DUF7824 domain-containing protein [Agromyces atrinae]|uniref:DUF7824 domain-containing protein n=1 Tax=Agromyces atrinae TaxID=592376 RepID=A0A4Q2M3S4_9MICO|nr:DUF6493 family protein [Agromyces atrinae]NYD66345.1 hypothetical protein [Agromyces atrinae]RXZ86664.1 hypothetical protein ESP50_09775 [Agromyces atrinae]